MNEEEILLFTWVKFLAQNYNLFDFSPSKNIQNRSRLKFLDIFYEENFLFKFFIAHFNIDMNGIDPNPNQNYSDYKNSNYNLTSQEKINMIKYFLNKNFSEISFSSESFIKTVFPNNTSDNLNKDNFIVIWKIIFTLTFLHEYSVVNTNMDGNKIFNSFAKEAKEEEELQIYHVYNLYKTDNEKIIKNLRKNTLLFKNTIKIVSEILDKISYEMETEEETNDTPRTDNIQGLFTFDEIEKLFLEVNKFCKNKKENEKDKTIVENFDISKCKSQNQSQFICSPCKNGNVNLSYDSQNEISIFHNIINSPNKNKVSFNLNLPTNFSTNNLISTVSTSRTLKDKNKIPTENLNHLQEQITFLTTSLVQLEVDKKEFINSIDKLLDEKTYFTNLKDKLELRLKFKEGIIKDKDSKIIELNEKIENLSFLNLEINEKNEYLQDKLNDLVAVKKNNEILSKEINKIRNSLFNEVQLKMQRFSFNYLMKGNMNSEESIIRCYSELLETKNRILNNRDDEMLRYNEKNLELMVENQNQNLKMNYYKEKINELHKIISERDLKIKKYREELKRGNEKNSSLFSYGLIFITSLLIIILFFIIFKIILK